MSESMRAAFNGVISQDFAEEVDEDATVVPVGLDFGPTWIHISFSVDREGISEGPYSTGVPGEKVYMDFYKETLSKKVQGHVNFEELPPPAKPLVPTKERASELVEAFRLHIEGAVKLGVWALDKNPKLNFKVMAITVPDHWDASARTIVANAARDAKHPLDSSYMILKFPRAVQMAYEMHKYVWGRFLTLMIHYHKSYLHLMLVEMFENRCFMKGQVRLPHLGEDEIKASSGSNTTPEKASGDDSPGGQLVSDQNVGDQSVSADDTYENSLQRRTLAEGTEVYQSEDVLNEDLALEPSISTHPAYDDTASPDDLYIEPPVNRYPPVDLEPIQAAIKKFIILMTPTNAPTPDGESSLHLKFGITNKAYIVIDGDATPKGIAALDKAIKEMFAETEGIDVVARIFDCGARGAELAARRHFQNPKHLGDWKELPEYRDESAA